MSQLEKYQGGVPREMARMLKTPEGNIAAMFERLSDGARAKVLEGIAAMKREGRKDPRAVIEALPVIMKVCEEICGEHLPSNERLVYRTGMSDAELSEQFGRIVDDAQEELLRGGKGNKTRAPGPTVH